MTGYRVERCQGAACTNFVEVAQASGTTFNDTGLAAGTTYRYRVRAVDAASNLGPYSGIAGATTPAPTDTQPPSAPANLAATAVELESGRPQLDGVDGQRRGDGLPRRALPGATCTNFARGRDPRGHDATATRAWPASTIYRYRVRAADAAGNLSAYSAIAERHDAGCSGHGGAVGAGEPDGGVRSSASQVNLNWTASTDNVGVTGYRVERCQGAACTELRQIATPTGTSYSNTGLTPNTTYRYRVRAAGRGSEPERVLEHRQRHDDHGPGRGLLLQRGGRDRAWRCYPGTATTARSGPRPGTSVESTAARSAFNGTNARVTIPDAPVAAPHHGNDPGGVGVPRNGDQHLAGRDLQGRRQLLPLGDLDPLGRTRPAAA